MNALEWFIAGTAELTVAYREDWTINRISRHAWLVFAIYVASAILTLSLLVDSL